MRPPFPGMLRGGERPPTPLRVPTTDYLAYVAQATPSGWNPQLFTWTMRDVLPTLPIPLWVMTAPHLIRPRAFVTHTTASPRTTRPDTTTIRHR